MGKKQKTEAGQQTLGQVLAKRRDAPAKAAEGSSSAVLVTQPMRNAFPADAMLQNVLKHYEEYTMSKVPFVAPMGPAADAARRSSRKRKATARASHEGGGADSGALDEDDEDILAELVDLPTGDVAAQQDEAAAAAARQRKEGDGHRFLQLLRGLVTADRTLPRTMQEHLLRLVMAADRHATDLSVRALRLLDLLRTAHPPCRFVAAADPSSSSSAAAAATGGGGSADTAVFLVNEDMATLRDLTSAHLFTHNLPLDALLQCATRALRLATGKELPPPNLGLGVNPSAQSASAAAAAAAAPPERTVGDVLLLKHLVSCWEDDLAARFAAAERFPQSAAGLLQDSQLWRVLNDASSSTWRGDRSKGMLVYRLVAIVAAAGSGDAADGGDGDDDNDGGEERSERGGEGSRSAAKAQKGAKKDKKQAQREEAGERSDKAAAAASGGGGGSAAADPQQPAVEPERLFSPLELAALALRLLRLMYRMYEAADGAGLYADGGDGSSKTRSTRYNDRFEMECCVMEGLSGKDAWSETKSDGAKAAVLSRLPPALVLRMLAFTLAEAHTKRNFNDGRFPLLQVLHEYVFDKGMGRGAANNAAVDPAALLDCIRDEFAWAAGKLFGGLEGCVVFVTQLLIAVLRCRGGAPAGGGSSGGQFACDLSSVKQLYGDVAAKFAEHRQAADKLSASARAALEVAESMLLAAA